MPARIARKIAATENVLIENLSQAETITAITVIKAAITRRLLMALFLPPDKPTLSTNKEIAVCPARDATVNNATPAIGTTWVCMATKDAPNTPAPNCQTGSFLDLTAAKINPKPARVFLLETTIIVTKIRPVENETIAASSESPKRKESSPLIRD